RLPRGTARGLSSRPWPRQLGGGLRPPSDSPQISPAKPGLDAERRRVGDRSRAPCPTSQAGSWRHPPAERPPSTCCAEKVRALSEPLDPGRLHHAVGATHRGPPSHLRADERLAAIHWVIFA